MAARRDSWVRWFDVTNPTKHSDGYTIYKVTSKVFPVHSPEATTEIIVWKRYKDFLKLHKTLYLVHRNLHRPQAFPGFPKPQIFGRFDEAIIEERRQAALELLNFIASQAHLFNSLAVQQFFESTVPYEEEKSTDEQDVLQPVSFTPLIEQEVLEAERGSETNSEDADAVGTPVEGRGPENRPQEGETVEELSRENRLPEDRPLGERLLDNRPPSPKDRLEDVELDEEITSRAESFCVTSLSENGDITTGGDSSDTLVEDSTRPGVAPDLLPEDSQHLSDSDVDGNIMSEFDPIHDAGASMESSSITNSQLLADCVAVSQSGESMDKAIPHRLPPADTLATYVQGKNDYLYKAVKQIRKAWREESEGRYQVAFDYYKRAVAMLLTGVQGDGDEARRCVVRRKTAEYLLYAEELHSRHLDSTGENTDRWSQLKVPRQVAKLRAGLAELANFKVLGLIGGNMLVLDKVTEETSVIKVLQKNSEVTDRSWSNQVVPTKSSRMVKLRRYFETESTIYLLLEYAQGGTLWQYAHNYLQAPEPQDALPLPDGADNIYSGKKYCTSAEDETRLNPAADHSALSINQDERSQEYPKVDLSPNSSSREGVAVEDSTNNALIKDDGGPDKQAAVPPISPQGPTTDGVFCTDANRELHTGSSSGSSEHSATRRMSLRRSNSSKSRSASVERASDSVNSARHRNWSTVFEELEQSGKRHARAYLPESCVQRWAAELLLAIDELHRTGLILGDLQPDNLLLDSRGHIILTYFCQWPGVHQDILEKSASHFYVSPEARLPGGMCRASDYWSFGVLLYELLAGVSLGSVHPRGITSHTILQTPQHLSAEADHLLKQLLRCNPRERLGDAAGVEEIKAHPFFQTIDWSVV